MNLNKVFIIGNLTRDPELRNLPSGTPVASFGVATNRTWKNQQGQRQDEVQFHNIVVFGRQAETSSQYLTKGSLVFIEGRISNRSWEAQDGTKKYRTEIIAERIQFGPRQAGRGESGEGLPRQSKVDEAMSGQASAESLPEIDIGEEEVSPEDLPF